MIIGLAGPARAGKDIVASYLVNHFFSTRIAFADPLKDALNVMCHWRPNQWHDRGWKEESHQFARTPRVLMQTLGDWGRDVQEDFWIRLLEERVRLMTSGDDSNVVIPDVRFENEAQWVRSHGGSVWHISRAEVPPVAAHCSENGVRIASGDEIIPNNGTIPELFYRVSELGRKYRL